MSLFTAAMDKVSSMFNLGENGTLQYTASGVGNPQVALFAAFVRNTPTERVEQILQECISEAEQARAAGNEEQAASLVADLFVLAFQTRNCRGGKGEKALFDTTILKLYKMWPQTVSRLVHLIPFYGSFKDLFRLLCRIAADQEYVGLRSRIIDVVCKQLKMDGKRVDDWDAAKLAAGTNEAAVAPCRVSLCAKYAPREGKAFAVGANKEWFAELRHKLFTGHEQQSRVLYRRLITRISRILDVPEIKMCGKRFHEIDFKSVPSVCTNKNRKAFLNELTGRKNKGVVCTSDLGNRFPDDEDRVACRQHFAEAILSEKVNGKQVFPHDLVAQLMPSRGNGNVSALEAMAMNAQWQQIRADMEKKLADAQERLAVADPEGLCRGVDFRKLVPMVDVSGSMAGDPMHAAIALGILTSEINHPAFRDRFITFDTNPTWCNMSDLSSIRDKVVRAARAPWGGSTNIDAAFRLVLDVVVSHRIPENEIPDMIIFSDMQFDQACGRSADTEMQRIKRMFSEAGIAACGKPYSAPRIVFWNLRGDTRGFAAAADSPNVQLLAGFSPALLESVLSGEAALVAAKRAAAAGDKSSDAGAVTPYDTLRAVLDSEIYFKVRNVLHKSPEGILSRYSFVPPADAKSSRRIEPTAVVGGGGGVSQGQTDDGAMATDGAETAEQDDMSAMRCDFEELLVNDDDEGWEVVIE